MNNLLSKIIKSIQWNTFEVFSTHVLFMIHNTFLFAMLTAKLFGYSGVIFSIMYTSVSLLSFGFISGLSSFLLQATASQYCMATILFPQMLFSLFIYSLISPCIVYIILTYSPHISHQTTLLIISIIPLELIRKLCKTVLQLSFYNRSTAISETFLSMTYMGMVWGYWYIHNSLSLELLLTALFVGSLGATSYNLYHMYQLYQSRPTSPTSSSQQHTAETNYSILKKRCSTALVDLSHQLFSANIFIPLGALYWDHTTIAYLKYSNNLIYSLSSIIRKIFGSPLATLLLHTTDTRTTIHALTTLFKRSALCLLAISLTGLLCLSCTHNTQAIACFFITLLLHISELLFFMYETVLITHNKTDLSRNISCVMIAIIIPIYYKIATLPIFLLCPIIMIRIACLIYIHRNTATISSPLGENFT
ncbi:MAG: hypothetical protein WBQ73_02665 [Candidatus Babeliales bacterium]